MKVKARIQKTLNREGTIFELEFIKKNKLKTTSKPEIKLLFIN